MKGKGAGSFGGMPWCWASKREVHSLPLPLHPSLLFRSQWEIKKWEDGPTEQIAADRKYWTFKPGASWHGFKGYGENQYFLDPAKLMLITPGIDMAAGTYEDFGIPGTIVANFLRQNKIIPEKCDLNDILFLLTPAESKDKLNRLVDALVRFESLLDEDAPMEKVLPAIYDAYEAHYPEGYTIRRLCRELHDFYKKGTYPPSRAGSSKRTTSRPTP